MKADVTGICKPALPAPLSGMHLDEIRQQIDIIDTDIIRLLSERAELVHEVGNFKKRNGLEIYAPEREEALLQRLLAKNAGRLPEKSIRAIYREIMSAALALEEDLKIAYLGPEGTWTHQAALEKFGASLTYLPQANVRTVLEKIVQREAYYGVVPYENSVEGAVTHTLDLLADSSLKICAQIPLTIDVCLMSLGELAAIRRVYGHPGVIAQSRDWLSSHLSGVEILEVSSTSRAASLVHEEGDGTAMVGSPLTASLNDLHILARHLQDPERTRPQITRYVVVGRLACPPTGNDRTPVLITDSVNTQSLLETLRLLSELEIEVAQIESHPQAGDSRRLAFFVELKGHAEDLAIQDAVRRLLSQGKQVAILGSYPALVPPAVG